MFKRYILSLVVAVVGAGIISLSLLLVIITIALAFIVLMSILGIALFLKKKDAREGRYPIQETNDDDDDEKCCFVSSFH